VTRQQRLLLRWLEVGPLVADDDGNLCASHDPETVVLARSEDHDAQQQVAQAVAELWDELPALLGGAMARRE